MLLHKSRKAQAAVDFMMSYGIALVMIFIAIAVVYNVSLLSPSISAYACTAVPGFSCDAFALSRTGVLTVQLSQATGGQIAIRGAACSSSVNSIGNGPKYGNLYVTNSVSYYPTSRYPFNSPGNVILVYSGSGTTLNVFCYSSAGVSSGPLGNLFVGYLWLNYTIQNYGNTIQQVASLSLAYT